MMIEGLRQEVQSVATLKQVFQYPVVDNSGENKCVVMLVWQPTFVETNRLQAVFGREGWKQICNRLCQESGVDCKWMVDVNPNYFQDSVIAY